MNKKIIVGIAVLILIIAIISFCTYDKNKTQIGSLKTDEDLKEVTFNEIGDSFSNDCIGILNIEKIGLNATIKDGSNSDILNKYIGHIEGTCIYDGNVGLAAHNRGNKYSYFARLNELEIGDSVIYKTRYSDKEYTVIDKKVILETDWDMLKDTEDNRLTMITCIKNKANQRLCVQALEINRKGENKNAEVN